MLNCGKYLARLLCQVSLAAGYRSLVKSVLREFFRIVMLSFRISDSKCLLQTKPETIWNASIRARHQCPSLDATVFSRIIVPCYLLSFEVISPSFAAICFQTFKTGLCAALLQAMADRKSGIFGQKDKSAAEPSASLLPASSLFVLCTPARLACLMMFDVSLPVFSA